MKKKREQKYEIYNHRILWITAHKNLALSRTSEDDALFYSLSAMLMMYFAFEGYLNWLGHLVAPEIWDKEKEFFNRPPYQGTLGKYLFLSKILVLQAPEQSKGPFQTAKELQQLRDKAVHPRTESGKRNVKFIEGKFPPNYRSWLSTKVSAKKRDRAEKDIEALVNELHQAAKVHYPNVITVSEPFTGMLGFDITDH
ncbi:MAG: hypothetical protein JRC93_09915 [Deltaproteobacteria bacterium]|nr:hypothetical protein [Deltaproteobacteria bacterium]